MILNINKTKINKIAIKHQGIKKLNICVDLPNETWKETEFENFYVSNLGRIKHYLGDVFHVMSFYKKDNGYLVVGIKGTKYYVHRLVAKAFIPNPYKLKTINHKDGNKENNNVDNLEWMSHENNIKHYFNKEVYQLDLQNNIINKFHNAREAAKSIGKLNMYNSIICCLNHKPRYNTANGFKWIYVKEYEQRFKI